MLERAHKLKVAAVHWESLLGGDELLAFATGSAEAASNAETCVTQLVQQYTIRAQVGVCYLNCTCALTQIGGGGGQRATAHSSEQGSTSAVVQTYAKGTEQHSQGTNTMSISL